MTASDLSTSPRAIWRLAWPQMLMMYLVFIMGLITVWVAGQISADVQAALGMVTQCTLLLMVVVMAMSSGALAAVSQSLGAQRPERARRYVGVTVLGSFGLGFVMAAAGWLLADPILRLLNIPERILPLARDFWDVIMLTLPAQYVYAATGVMFRATRQVIPPLQVAALLCVLTLAGCLGFGLGWFGLPACGAQGILWTNFAAQLAGALCNCLLLRRSGYLRRSAVPDCRWLRVGLPYLLRVALPAGAAQIVWQSGYLVLFVLVASVPLDSIAALAGLTAGLRVEGILFLPGMAFNMTAGVLVGNCLGAGNPQRAGRIALNLTGIAAAAMSLIALGLWPFRQDIAALMAQDPATQAQIVNYLVFNLISTPFSIASTVMGGVMNGAGATRYNLFIFGGGLWCVRLPLGWLLGHQLWGTATGIFAAMLISQIVQALCMLHVVLHRDWTRFAMQAHKFHAQGARPAAATKG